MHAPDRSALVRQRVVDLRNVQAPPEGREFLLAKKTQKKAALIVHWFSIDREQAL